MPVSYVADGARQRVRMTVSMPVSASEFIETADRQWTEGMWGVAGIIDLRGVHVPSLAEDLPAFVAHLRQLVDLHGPRGPVAIVARDADMLMAAHMAAHMSGHFSGHSDSRVLAFKSPEEAEAWLDRAPFDDSH